MRRKPWKSYNPWRDLADLPRGVWVLFAATVVNRAGSMVLPFLTLYFTSRLGYTVAHAGSLVAVYGAASLFASPLSGRLCDRVGPVRVMMASLFLSGTLLLVFPLARGTVSVVVATLGLAVVSEAFRPASLSITSDLVPAVRRRSAFALSRLAVNLGMSVGPAVGGFLAERSFTSIFVVDGATSLAAGIILASSSLRKVSHLAGSTAGTNPPPVSPRPHRRAFADPALLLFLAATMPVAVVFFQHVSAMPLYLVRDLQLSASTYGLLFTVNTVLIVFLEVPLNVAMRVLSHRRALASGALLTGLGFGALALATDVWTVMATVIVWTFGEMVLFPGMAAYVADIAPPGRSGEYMGLYTMSFGLAFTIGPALGTIILERYGGQVLWGAMFGLGALSAIMFGRLHGAKRSESGIGGEGTTPPANG